MSLLPFSLSLLAILIISIIVIMQRSLEALQVFGYRLFISSTWNPEIGVYGLLAPLVGSIVTSLLAVFFALVFSLPLTITITEHLRGISKKIVTSIVELMGGIPTIVYAVWASQYLVPFLKTFIMEPLHRMFSFIPLFSCRPATGFSVLSAGFAIGISIIPYVTALMIEAYHSIPIAYKEACYGIGATRYETIRIMLSLSRPAILAALILGLARSLGETTIAVATVGNSMYLSACLFAPSYTVPALIASQFANAHLYAHAESVLYTSILVVMLISVMLSFYASTILIRWRSRIVV
uniref:Phosphate ABC transporter permease subunit PstC n=1 Tax=Ignisphaera aggregans TaxID=334771 RepID=A0A7C2ZPX7_9CREN